MTFTDGTASRTENIRYLVVNANSVYNILLGRPALNRLRGVSSTRHMKLKMPDLSDRVIVIKSDQHEAKKCYENSLKTKRGVFMVVERPPSADTPMEVEPIEEAVPVGEMPVEVVPTEEAPEEAVSMEETSEAASPMEEALAETTPRRERRGGVSRAENAWDRRLEPVENVVERQIGGKTDLNKACPKNSYPLPNIDALVDSVMEIKIKKRKKTKMKMLKRILAHHPFYLKGLQGANLKN